MSDRNNGSLQRPVEILLVEDNPGDIRLTREALNTRRVANNLHVARTGEEALEFLKGRRDVDGWRRPDLVLLDLNLPGISGHEVLSEMRADPRLKTIPVVVLTSSESEKDILKSYDLQANCFISKPVNFERFLEVVASIEQFWLMVVRLPGDADSGEA